MLDREPFRLGESEVLHNDFRAVEEAARMGRTILAEGLVLDAAQIRRFRGFLPRDESERPIFDSWRFTGTEFRSGGDFSSCVIRGCSFRDCRFEAGASFGGSVFGRAIFKNASFGDGVDFERVEFMRRAEFHGARFGNRARFAYATFRAASQFFATRFGSEAGFANAHFVTRARFHDARFGSRANFSKARFAGGADFGAAAFGEKLQMGGARFTGKTTFLGASVGPRARLTDWRVGGGRLNMQSVHFLGAVSLHGGRIAGSATFDYARFDGSVDLGDVVIAGSGSFLAARFGAAERLGPIRAAEELVLADVLIGSACVVEVGAAVVDFSGARFLAPIRLVVHDGDAILDRVATGPRLVVTTPVASAPATSPRLVSIRDADIGPMLVSGLDVKALRFDGADGIDSLHVESGASFEHAPRGARAHREVIAEEHRLRHESATGDGWYPSACEVTRSSGADPRRPDKPELARIYRGLRKAREDSRDAPGAADFYYGEMEMRRLHAHAGLSKGLGVASFVLHAGNLVLLELYRALGGYGVRPGRPFLAFVALALLSAAAVDCGDLIHLTSAGPHHTILVANPDFEAAVVFVLRSALLLPTTTGTVLTTTADWVQIAARIIGPLLLGLFVLGLRARVHR